MKIELEDGTVIEGSDQVLIDVHVLADLNLDYQRIKEENAKLKKENSVLIDAAESNAVLRANAEKAKKVSRFQRTSAQMFRKASRALWKTFQIEVEELQEDGTRLVKVFNRDYPETFIGMFVPAERAAYIETVFKPDGTFANREDVLRVITRNAELQRKQAEEEGEEDE